MSFQEMTWAQLSSHIRRLATPSGSFARTVHGARLNFVDWNGKEPINLDFDDPEFAAKLQRAGDSTGYVGQSVLEVDHKRRPVVVEGVHDASPGDSVMVYMIHRKTTRKPKKS